jgi:hypothetical protein
MDITKNLCICIIVIVLIIYFLYKTTEKEYFNDDGTEFVGLGHKQYDLRGTRLRTHPIDDCLCDNYICY